MWLIVLFNGEPESGGVRRDIQILPGNILCHEDTKTRSHQGKLNLIGIEFKQKPLAADHNQINI
ncbi:MAG: hypothetical protein C0623_05075 [Desulfuromonas sp.]|nr:MAG: hypothetical protein C0623_05075 [Desulfuromonas sp.]